MKKIKKAKKARASVVTYRIRVSTTLFDSIVADAHTIDAAGGNVLILWKGGQQVAAFRQWEGFERLTN